MDGVPPILLGVVTWYYLTERLAEAGWLAADERAWLSQTMEDEVIREQQQLILSPLQVLFNPRVLAVGWTMEGKRHLLASLSLAPLNAARRGLRR